MPLPDEVQATKALIKSNWIEECQKAFKHINESISSETLLIYSDCNMQFVIHTDANKV